jgi:protein involved in temperature-dependent protein secretion
MDDQGMIDGFDKYLRAEIKQSPDDATDYYRLAKLQAIRGVPQEAESLLKKVVELTPGTPLARKSRTLIRGLAESLAERAFLAADKEEFIKEARQKATIENIKFSNKEQAEENARKMKQNQAVAQATKTKESAAKDKEIAELKKQGEKDKLYSNLFWANPTNAYLMENNYDKTRIEANLSNKGVMETIPLAITRP